MERFQGDGAAALPRRRPKRPAADEDRRIGEVGVVGEADSFGGVQHVAGQDVQLPYAGHAAEGAHGPPGEHGGQRVRRGH